MAYEKLALLYDSLMDDSAYDQWVAYLMAYLHANDIKGNRLLDVACGTGRMALKLTHNGFDVTGTDLSETMLSIAQERTSEQGIQMPLYKQDMRDLELDQTFDIVTIFCDSLNYLESPEDVKETIMAVEKHLSANGLLVFDVHSVKKINEDFVGHSFSYQDEEKAYIWDTFQGEASHSVIHELTFFYENDQGFYERFDEDHYQRTYPGSFYKETLKAAGFKIIHCYADFTFQSPEDTSERWFFFAQK